MVIGYVSYVHTYYIKLMHFNYKYIHTYIPAQLQTESSSNHTIMCQMLKHLKWPLHSQASCYQQKLLAHAPPMISTPISAYSRPQKITQIHIPNKFSVSIFFTLYLTIVYYRADDPLTAPPGQQVHDPHLPHATILLGQGGKSPAHSPTILPFGCSVK